MQKPIWAALLLLLVSSSISAETVTVTGDGNTGTLEIPDGSTITDTIITPNSDPRLVMYQVDYTFAGGSGDSIAIGSTEGHFGSINFLQPVTNLSFDWDAPTMFSSEIFDGNTLIGLADGMDMGSGPMEVQGTSNFAGPVTSITWDGDIFGGGIESLTFKVPEPSAFTLILLGLWLFAGLARFRKAAIL
jgi:hypothetical protein